MKKFGTILDQISYFRYSFFVSKNSFFEKPDEKKVTRSDWNAKGAPYTPDRYAEIDHILPNQRMKNMVKDIESDTSTYFPSDHFPVNWRLKIKLAKNKDRVVDQTNKWKSPPKPSETTKTTFNNSFESNIWPLLICFLE